MTIVKRLDKGSELTHAELDGNFTDLDTRVTVIEGSSGLSNVVEDTTPQLGGALDTNGNNITFSGNTKAQFGASQDLSIFHNNNHSIIRETGTGSLYLQSDNNVILSTDSSTKIMVKGIANGATELYHNDIKKFETTADGVEVTGTLNGHTIPAGTGTLALLSDIGGGGGATNMAGLTDVDSVDTVASGDFLLYDGSSTEYKFVAFEAEVNGLIDGRTGSSGHVSTQSQYTTKVTTDPADPTDTAHHVLSNTGTPSIQGASTAWYYGDVISDPANPTTSIVLDIDSAILTGDVMGDITSNGTSTFNGTVDFSATSSVDFTGATVSGLSGSTWATLGDKDGANGPSALVLGRNAIAQSSYGVSLGNQSLTDGYGIAIGMETQAAGYDVNVGSFSGKNHVVTDHGYRVAIGAFAQQNANPGNETGVGAIAIGTLAGDANQGANSVAIGRYAGRNNQAAQSIVLNATGVDLENITPDSFVVKPIRQEATAQALYYNPVTGEVTYEAAGGGGGGSGLQSRILRTNQTSSLADGAEADLDITGFKAYALLTITTDRAARVRVYVNAATRTADASRAEGVDPTSDAGLIAEVITTGAESVIISPGAYGFNLENFTTTNIPCRVTNKSGSTSTVQVSLNVVQLEA
jgi:hypothetical protein